MSNLEAKALCESDTCLGKSLKNGRFSVLASKLNIDKLNFLFYRLINVIITPI